MPINVNFYNSSSAVYATSNQQAINTNQQNSDGVASVALVRKRIGNSTIETTPTNKSGMIRSFKTARSNQIIQRSRIALTLIQSQQLLSNAFSLSQAAKLDMDRVKSLELGAYPVTKNIIDEMSRASLGRYSRGKISDLDEALDIYRGDYGDNILMNIYAKGHPTLEHYLRSVDASYNEPKKVKEYVEEFANHYNCLTGMESEDDELDEIRTRIEDRIQQPAQVLINHLSSAPRLSAVPLLRGP
ncbi:hypothetical protein GIW45_26785 [Pseudomonas congelans]|uniref:hypothetical protein n=1 Tax=Pseudomonas congelans TaxID=200452 RepID=UPI001F309E9C|nr:hypothetical protein [Pseudomonas congelans]MCF5167541.1 hypothetical protein [Pseudomonas congelans]